MILRPRLMDYRIIFFYLSKTIIGFSLLMFVPFLVAIFYQEINPAIDYAIGIVITLSSGLILQVLFYTNEDLGWMHSMVVVSVLWLFIMIFSAIPLYLSGHFGSFLDACFEAMSGITTTGFSLVQNLDHLPKAHNFWRHFTHFIGGQGIVIVALSILFKGSSGAFRLYIGEARDERPLPNVIQTARFIWLVSLLYLIIGSSILTFILVFEGLDIQSAVFHSVCLFMAAFDTAGFTPTSMNIAFYHSPLLEVALMAIMIIGALNFHLHYKVMTGGWKEIYKNIETRILFFSILFLFILVCLSIKIVGELDAPCAIFRKGFFHLISAHTTTGFQTIPPSEFIQGFGFAGSLAIIVAMSLGGSACSTAGSIKLLRIGVLIKSIALAVRRIMLPERAVVIQKIHHIKDLILDDKYIKTAAIMTISYIVLILVGSFVGMFLGYGFFESIFESASASGNVGLTIGITQPSMHWFLKVVYILQMWVGRLEFLSIFSLVGLVIAIIKGRQ